MHAATGNGGTKIRGENGRMEEVRALPHWITDHVENNLQYDTLKSV